MATVRSEPLRELLSIQERMNRMFDDAFRGGGPEGEPDDRAPAGCWAPPVDIFERGHDLVLTAELPGIDAENVEIRLENGVLTLSGERKPDPAIERRAFHRVERSYGRFSRAITLPTAVDQEQIQADYRDGVLRITLPRSEATRPRRIRVESA